MNQATERPEGAESPPAAPADLPAGQAGVAEEKPQRTARRKAAAAVEASVEATVEAQPEAAPAEEPAPAYEPVPTAESLAPSAEAGPPGGQPGPAAATRPERKRHGRYIPRRKVCAFCVDHVREIDYKDVGKIRRYLSDRGKIEPRRKTGTCAKHQRRLTIALKRARHLALLPYTAEHIRLTGTFAPRS
jgi:small subunit ribosomal protein S18